MSGKLSKSIVALSVLLPAALLFGPFAKLPFYRMLNLSELALLLLGALFAVQFLTGKRERYSFGAARPGALFFAVMLLYAAISLLWVKNARVSFNDTLFYQLCGIAAALCITVCVQTREKLLRLLDVLTVCFILTVLLGTVEIFTGFYLFSPTNPELPLRNIYNLRFPYASFNNTNDFSTYVTVFMPFAAYTLVERFRGILGKAAALLLCADALFTLFNADPRVCYVAMVIMAAAFVFAVLCRRGGRRYLKQLGLLAVCVVGVVVLLRFTCQVRAASVVGELKTLNTANHSVSERMMLTRASLKMFVDSHFMGVGTGNGVQLMTSYSASVKPLNLHNMTLQILTEYGIIIFALYALMMLWLLLRFLRVNTGSFRTDVLSCICFCTVCGFPIVGIASSDTTRLLAVWVLFGLWFACVRVFYDKGRGASAEKASSDETAAKRMPRLLFISFIDFGDMSSGSSVRPQMMEKAFRELGYEVVLLSGLQNRRLERLKNVFRLYREIRENLPDLCYVEPPSGPFFNLCDHLLLIWLKFKRVPVGLFYRDAYWKFAQWWQVRGLKRFFVIKMQQFDLFVFKRICKVLFFPTNGMAALFDTGAARKSLLPPAGRDLILPSEPAGREAVFQRVVYVGGVSARYGTDILLEALDLLNRRGRAVSLTLVCREAENGAILEPYRGRLWLTVMNASGDGQLAPIYRSADAAIYPGRRDAYMNFAMPVKLFEYMSYGLPVVTTNCDEAAAFVEKNGFGLISQDNPESLAAQIARLYDEPSLLGELRERCAAALRGGNLWTHRARSAAEEILRKTNLKSTDSISALK